MIDAPDFGQVVKVQPYRYKGDDYAGATRPAGSIASMNVIQNSLDGLRENFRNI